MRLVFYVVVVVVSILCAAIAYILASGLHGFAIYAEIGIAAILLAIVAVLVFLVRDELESRHHC